MVVRNRLRVKDVLWIHYLVINEVTLHLLHYGDLAESRQLCLRSSESEQLCSLMCFPANLLKGSLWSSCRILSILPPPIVEYGVEGRERGLRLVSYTGGVGACRLLGPLELEFPIAGWRLIFILVPLPWFSLHCIERGWTQVRSCPGHPGERCWWPGLILEHPESGWSD